MAPTAVWKLSYAMKDGLLPIAGEKSGLEATRRIIAVGFPTKTENIDYLKTCATPKIFVQSTHDEHGPRQELEMIYRDFAEPKHIYWVEAVDHFFRDGLDALEETILQLKA